jgi:hypothetical protein
LICIEYLLVFWSVGAASRAFTSTVAPVATKNDRTQVRGVCLPRHSTMFGLLLLVRFLWNHASSNRANPDIIPAGSRVAVTDNLSAQALTGVPLLGALCIAICLTCLMGRKNVHGLGIPLKWYCFLWEMADRLHTQWLRQRNTLQYGLYFPSVQVNVCVRVSLAALAI